MMAGTIPGHTMCCTGHYHYFFLTGGRSLSEIIFRWNRYLKLTSTKLPELKLSQQNIILYFKNMTSAGSTKGLLQLAVFYPLWVCISKVIQHKPMPSQTCSATHFGICNIDSWQCLFVFFSVRQGCGKLRKWALAGQYKPQWTVLVWRVPNYQPVGANSCFLHITVSRCCHFTVLVMMILYMTFTPLFTFTLRFLPQQVMVLLIPWEQEVFKVVQNLTYKIRFPELFLGQQKALGPHCKRHIMFSLLWWIEAQV